MLDTPVLFLIFNRPDLTEQVFVRIRQAQPKQFFVAADGPRQNNTADIELCKKTRDIIIKNVDWDCEVRTLFREKNLGCRVAVSEAITWFFKNVEQGIILEDDTLPHIDFFQFAEQLLNRYKTDERIFHIGGNNFQMSYIGKGSYYLSKIPHIWGWATWRRSWLKYNEAVTSSSVKILPWFNDIEIDLYWKNYFSKKNDPSIDEWGFLWVYTLFSNNAYALLPQYNLVKNIGFDERSYRTGSANDYLSNLKVYNINELHHPSELNYDKALDINFQKLFGWYIPKYENRISGVMAFQTLIIILKRKFFSHKK